jgi:hypothetical protein
MKYYKVVAKCGHVGKNRYYEGVFFEKANNGKEAAYTVRFRPRVKHDHKDAILSVLEITLKDYLRGLKSRDEPFFNCKNSYQQRIVWEKIVSKIYTEKDDNYAKSCYSGKKLLLKEHENNLEEFGVRKIGKKLILIQEQNYEKNCVL